MRKFFLAMALTIGCVTSAVAAIMTDITEFHPTGTNPSEDLTAWGDPDTVNFLSAPDFGFDGVGWTHHFTIPAGAITAATIRILLEDDGDGDLFNPEGGAIATDDGVVRPSGEMDTNWYIYDVGTLGLADGEFRAAVTVYWGDIYIRRSELTINYEPSSVPEPGTLACVSLGLLAAFATRRKGESGIASKI